MTKPRRRWRRPPFCAALCHVMTVQSCRRSHASPRPVKFIELAQSRGWMNCRHGVSGSHSSMKPWDLKKKSPTRLPLAAQVNPLFSSKRKSPGSCRMTTTTAPLDRKQMAFVVELSGFLYVRRGNHRLSLCVFVLQQSSSYQSHITDEIQSALPAVPLCSTAALQPQWRPPGGPGFQAGWCHCGDR